MPRANFLQEAILFRLDTGKLKQSHHTPRGRLGGEEV
jgi:hypothetical protein